MWWGVGVCLLGLPPWRCMVRLLPMRQTPPICFTLNSLTIEVSPIHIFIVLDPCPTYYTLLRDSCYIIDQNQTWSRDDAQAHCEGRGGHLVDLETEQEVEVIRTWIKGESLLTTVVKKQNLNNSQDFSFVNFQNLIFLNYILKLESI